MLNQIYAIKQRMSQEFLGGKRVPVTSLLVPSHQVVSEKTVDRDGYRSLVIALGQAKKMTTKKSLLGFLKSKELNFTPKRIKEIKLAGDDAIHSRHPDQPRSGGGVEGSLSSSDSSTIARNDKQKAPADLLEIETLITPNSLITVSAKSKGKGFAGVVKRWGFAGGPRTHGQSDRQRTPGSIGRGTTPGRVLPGKKMPGRMGGENISTKNLTVIAYDPASGVLKVKGTVPGSINAFVTIKITHLAKLDSCLPAGRN